MLYKGFHLESEEPSHRIGEHVEKPGAKTRVCVLPFIYNSKNCKLIYQYNDEKQDSGGLRNRAGLTAKAQENF